MTETLTLPADARAARADRIPVAVLGATGSVGQRFVQLLEHHPWFRLHEVVASERSAGKSYGAAADWRLDSLLSNDAAALTVKSLGSELESRLLFSGLDSSVAGDADNGVASLAILDNVIPYISGEEEKLEIEPRKILGTWDGERFVYAPMRISAQTNRVPTIDGHLMTISLSVRGDVPTIDDVKDALRSFKGIPQELDLPSAPRQPIHVLDEPDRPQPRLDRDRERGMAVSVGRIRPCNLLHIRMVALVHNTIRGAAGAALLNAELLDARGLL